MTVKHINHMFKEYFKKREKIKNKRMIFLYAVPIFSGLSWAKKTGIFILGTLTIMTMMKMPTYFLMKYGTINVCSNLVNGGSRRSSVSIPDDGQPRQV